MQEAFGKEPIAFDFFLDMRLGAEHTKRVEKRRNSSLESLPQEAYGERIWH